MSAYTEIVDFTFTANETSRTFSGLSITKDDFVKVVVNSVDGSGSNRDISMFPNTAASVSGFNTNTNYHSQILRGTDSSVVAARVNTNNFDFQFSGQTGTTFGYLKISENGKFNAFVNNTISDSSTLQTHFSYITSSNLTFSDPITSLTFTSSATNGLGTGSRIQIYKLDAVKVADITVTSNTTQVDISNLSIDKDSEYLLVSDVKPGASVFDLSLFVNNNITAGQYNSQLIMGNNTVASAERTNNARYALSADGALSYSHIKLSNIGAYTSQNYTIRRPGQSNIILQNFFVSSTAENITSITQLNIRSAQTNAIGTGSRFILYKLYE